ncbi:argonaute-like protein, partial [Mycena filopes]
HITTIGVRRPKYGSAGRVIPINVNSFTVQIPQGFIFHYDVGMTVIPATNRRKSVQLVKELQDHVAPEIFAQTRCAFDGRNNLYAPAELNLGGNSREFDVILPPLPGAPIGINRPPTVYKIRLVRVAKINKEVLHRFIAGKQSQDDSAVNTALMALNVVIRMAPSEQDYTMGGRSFFTEVGSNPIGAGLVLWRGYFQSIRPAVGRLLINVDISTGVMYKPGPLIRLCLDFFNQSNPRVLAGLSTRRWRDLSLFIKDIRVLTRDANANPDAGAQRIRVVKKLSQDGADNRTFVMRDETTMIVADYYEQITGRRLEFPGLPCVQLGEAAWIPLELCTVLPGQLVRKELPDDKIKAITSFATMKPKERLASILEGRRTLLEYGQSEYVRQFGLSVDSAVISTKARVLTAPTLTYGPGSKIANIAPRDGSWNMVDKRFYRPARIAAWVLVVFDINFRDDMVQEMAKDFISACRSINVLDPSPIIRHINGQGDIAKEMQRAGADCSSQKAKAPSLFVAILPNHGDDIYTMVKHWGDVVKGVPTQCLKSSNCKSAKSNFWSNVALKVNGKLGGINVIVDPAKAVLVSDPNKPTVVMGADVMHPGQENTPSYAAVVSSVDLNAARYVAVLRVQASKQELISDLQEMTEYVLGKYLDYRKNAEKASDPAPKRLIFYRDGVSEGQFQQVLDFELPRIKAACEALKINPTITLVVVGKRHHIRLFPVNAKDGDKKTGNLPAGTVVDRDIGHPTEFDFYLQSHSGLLGTSRPGHYSVLYDENNLSADAMQAFSFALCHVYAPSTRSVSIPTPVYYADKVCARARIHFDPTQAYSGSDSGATDSSQILETYKKDFKALHPDQERRMYFTVSTFLCSLVAARC